MLISLSGLDKEVQSRIKFFEQEFNCLISIHEKNNEFFMNVGYLSNFHIEKDIKLCSKDCNKYIFMKAIRKYFKPETYK